MPKLFGVDIAGEINRAMGPGLLAVTLTKVTAFTRSTGSLSAGQAPTQDDFSGRGFIEDYEDKQIDGTLVVTGDRKISVLGASLSAVPTAGDKITVEGLQYNIVRVKRDPAAAVYVCQVRGPNGA